MQSEVTRLQISGAGPTRDSWLSVSAKGVMALGGGGAPAHRQNYRVEPECVRSDDHPQMRLAFRRCLLTSRWHMQIENLIIEDDAPGTSRTDPTSTPSSSRRSTTATHITGARSIATSIRGASLTLWAGVHGWSLRLRTLGSARP